MYQRFEPIAGIAGVIIDAVMDSPDMPQDPALLLKIRLAVEESVENIVNYAYENGSGYLEAATERSGSLLAITLKDAGTPFNPLDREDPDITLSAEERPIGGLGIFLCKQLMDSVEYAYRDGCNVLTLRKEV
ncbi:MAG: ATP-binding protein [Akkermansia sp.]|nr:ATP-binding protein [Akkermansia sp.]